MKLTIHHACNYFTQNQWESDAGFDPSQVLYVGDTVEYKGHIPGGMILAHKSHGIPQMIVLDPNDTCELRS